MRLDHSLGRRSCGDLLLSLGVATVRRRGPLRRPAVVVAQWRVRPGVADADIGQALRARSARAIGGRVRFHVFLVSSVEGGRVPRCAGHRCDGELYRAGSSMVWVGRGLSRSNLERHKVVIIALLYINV